MRDLDLSFLADTEVVKGLAQMRLFEMGEKTDTQLGKAHSAPFVFGEGDLCYRRGLQKSTTVSWR